MRFVIFRCLAVLFILYSANATAQILNPKKLLERKANRVIEKKTDEAVDSILEKKKKDTPDQNTDQQTDEQTTEPQTGNEPAEKSAKTDQPVLQSYSKYDFIPGEKIIFYDDFSQDAIGDFPALWNTNGSAEIVTTNLYPGRWMKFVSQQSIWTDALLKLPENYTIEFDVIPVKGEGDGMAGYNFRLIQCIEARSFDGGAVPGKAGFLFSCEYSGRPGYRSYVNGDENEALDYSGYKEDRQYCQEENKKYHIAIWVQKSRIRLYQDQNKLFDLPRAFPSASTKLDRLRFEEGAAMITNVRIAAGAPDMRNKLLTEGKLVSYGIYFDVNKDLVKPESYGTLKEIATLLKDNPTVRIRIVGHTDADGADAANLELSKKRAAAVKNELVKTFEIDASRIETDGKGETEAIAANDTPANKALNRRVEFIKL